MKKEYLHPEIEITELETTEDILTTSTNGGIGAGGVTDNEESGYLDWL